MRTPTQVEIHKWAHSSLTKREEVGPKTVIEEYAEQGLRFQLSRQSPTTLVVTGVEDMPAKSLS